jgi:hypothetical protein
MLRGSFGLFILCLSLFVGQASAQSYFADVALENPRANLGLMKRLLQDRADLADARKQPQNFYQVDTCMYAEGSANSARQSYVANMEAIAWNELYMATSFRSAGYPDQVWEEPLRAAMDKQVDVISDLFRNGRGIDISNVKTILKPYERRIVAALESYRRSQNPRLPQYYAVGMCGGDWIGFVKLRSDPPGAAIRVITDFNYKLCRSRGIDPYTGGCNDLWKTVGPSTQLPQGTYRYKAQWPSGRSECDRAEFIHTSANADRADPYTLKQTNQYCAQ